MFGMPQATRRRPPLHACRAALAVIMAIAAARSEGADPFAAETGVLRLAADPALLRLIAGEPGWRLLVTATRNDGREIDCTHKAELSVADPAVAAAEGFVIRGLTAGRTEVVVRYLGSETRVEVQVRAAGAARVPSFEHDVIPLLNRYGCNASACHGKAEGQNGFKLSVFGSDPAADWQALVMEDRGRRVFPGVPERSLLLRKAAGIVPHGGGSRIPIGSHAYGVLRQWIAAGLPHGGGGEREVVAIELAPTERLLDPGAQQQLRVVAQYASGERADVTALSRFQSNNEGLASVDEDGLVTAGNVPGQAAVMAAFMGHVATFQTLVPLGQPLPHADPMPEYNFIDRHVNERLRKLNLPVSPQAGDAEFLRRAYLDVIGTLPTAAEARRFLADPSPDRRARLVDALLQRPEFADYWALKWADVLRIDRGALGHKGAFAFYRWLRQSLAEGKPLDVMVREILTAEGPLAEVPQAWFYSAMQGPGETASSVSQIFLGVRIACAQCHHHPFDRWSQSDYYGMADYFAPLARKPTPRGEALLATGHAETRHPRTGELVLAHALGEPMPAALPPGDRRAGLAAWLTSPRNPWFARHQANRLWAHFMGRGLVEPVDDVRATNPPSNPELLDALAGALVEQRFDLRQMIRLITASAAYQRSSQPCPGNERDEQNYSRALFKRMDAEVLLDAVCQVTGVPEKFEGVPAGSRAIQLWDSKVDHYFLSLFGRPVRQTVCTCERNAEASVAQVLHLLNSPQIQGKLSHAGGLARRLAETMADEGELVDELYLTYFSRYPSETERQRAVDFLRAAASRREAVEDLAWSLLNTLEFVFNH
jgi:hypothetical protein